MRSTIWSLFLKDQNSKKGNKQKAGNPKDSTYYKHMPLVASRMYPKFSSLQFSRSVVSNSLRPHESQHTTPPCPSPTPGVHSDSHPSSQWCHPAISSSVVPFSSCPQSLPASESFPMSQLFAWGGQSTGVSASASFPPKKSQGWSPSQWTGWISKEVKTVQSTKTSQTLSPTCHSLSIIPDTKKVH